MKHLVYVLTQAVRHPLIALTGIREFRTDFTTHYDDLDELESYDSGRELAHLVTLRRFDNAA